jgi:MoaA/NifB/PqqE/SkfB family radical SAM enzyme
MQALDQVFLYVTQRCNIRCVTCYALDQLERSDDLDVPDVLRLLADLRRAGASRLSFLGGEPTIYRPLGDVATAARELGFGFVRVNTNGMFGRALLDDPRMRAISVWCFSIDGATAEVNDSIRKGSRLHRVVENMRLAVERGFEVRANATITSKNLAQVFDIISLVQETGAAEVNLNVMFLMGYALDHQDLSVTPDAWLATYRDIVRRHREFAIRIKLPPAFATLDELAHHRARGHRCLAVDRTRLYVTANGDAYPCLAFIDDPRQRVAAYADGRLQETPTPLPDSDDVHNYCHFVQMRADHHVPLCIFYKDRLP